MPKKPEPLLLSRDHVNTLTLLGFKHDKPNLHNGAAFYYLHKFNQDEEVVVWLQEVKDTGIHRDITPFVITVYLEFLNGKQSHREHFEFLNGEQSHRHHFKPNTVLDAIGASVQYAANLKDYVVNVLTTTDP